MAALAGNVFANNEKNIEIKEYWYKEIQRATARLTILYFYSCVIGK